MGIQCPPLIAFEMAVKRPLSAAYQRRIDKAMAAGKTLQQARGHKAGEHIIRREKTKLKDVVAVQWGDLSTKDKDFARSYGRERARNIHHQLGPVKGTNTREASDAALAYMRRVGPTAFRRQVAIQRAAHRQYLAEMAEGSYESRGPDLLDIWAADDGFTDPRWYFYH